MAYVYYVMRTGFTYTKTCSLEFKEEMRQCYDRWLGRHSVDSFSKHNDLIFAGKHNQLKDMCRSV